MTRLKEAYFDLVHASKPPAGNRPLKTLERVISKAGLGSRTEARQWIAAGRVKVNGRPVSSPEVWIDLERDRVFLDGKPLVGEQKTHLLLHKPAGYLTTYRDPHGRPTVYDLLPDRDRYLFPVGRLDLDTSGLLIMTNDTQFAERLTNPEYHVPKTYVVLAPAPIADEDLERLRDGIELRDGPTRPAVVRRLDPARFEITISEGRNRQVRRMVEAIGSEVVELTRVAIGKVRLRDLESGKSRPLSDAEVSELVAGVGRRRTKSKR